MSQVAKRVTLRTPDPAAISEWTARHKKQFPSLPKGRLPLDTLPEVALEMALHDARQDVCGPPAATDDDGFCATIAAATRKIRLSWSIPERINRARWLYLQPFQAHEA